MKSIKLYSLLLVVALFLGSCEELLDPKNDNHSTFERVYRDADFAEGLLITAYARIPTNGLSFNDVATDDAVSNVKLNSYLRMATGQWSALSNPVSQWDNCNSAILYLNKFLSIADTVEWKWTNKEIRRLMEQRFKGEAYALRGLFKYHLLQTVGGYAENGELLGIPIYDSFLENEIDFNTPRASFEESVASIFDDFDKALGHLVVSDYGDIPDAMPVPEGFEGVSHSDYNTVFGKVAMQRISGRIVRALKARVALLAASPAYSADNAEKWEAAAIYAADVLNTVNGVSGLNPNGHKWYVGTYVDAIKTTSTGLQDFNEMIWRRPRAVTNTREDQNFPPTLFGDGNINPTQNLVDAFPMANGRPISDPASEFDPANPYAGRDPRLGLYVIYDGSTFKGKVIRTGVGGGENARDSIPRSTRTGYYLKKLLREDVNMDPKATTTKNHYEVHMRYTELFLIYAEAANEAWGPDGSAPGASYTARQVIAAIRKRAGIKQPDTYLASIATKEEMRELIRNERRIELCFEGHRFWDLRRWKLDLTEPAKGVNINKAGNEFTVVEVEARAYDNTYQHYGPLPQTEVLKFSSLVQNKGW